MTTNMNTVASVVTNGNGAINDHTGEVMKLLGLCLLNNGEVGALLDTNKYYSINELYVKDGMAHISTRSITGTVSPDDDLTTPAGIESFNKTLTFNSRKIAKVVLIIEEPVMSKLSQIQMKIDAKYHEIMEEEDRTSRDDIYDILSYQTEIIGNYVFCTVCRLTIDLVDVYDANGEIVYQYDPDDETPDEVLTKLSK